LVSTSAPTTDVNAYGVAAIAGLAGLFSAQALEKLKAVFEVFFAKVPPDHSDPVVPSMSITDLSPTHAKVGEKLKITGTGLSKVNSVVFSKNISAVPDPKPADTSLTVAVPEGAATGPVTVSDTTGTQAKSPKDFTVDA
jgi:hypothetical protein